MVLSDDPNVKRKTQHIEIVLKEDVEGPLSTWFEYVHLIHMAASELSEDDIDLRTPFLGKILDYPLIISGMTGGAPGTEKINAALARVAEEFRVAMGVGSQRAAIINPDVEYTFKVVRREARDIPIVANVGAAEVVKYGNPVIEEIVSMIEADALAVHLNLAQEAVQPEGSPNFKGLRERLTELRDALSVPIIIKEVGQGLSYEVAKTLSAVGINYFDVAGSGGTNWVSVEMYRARLSGDKVKEEKALNLLSWGIPTAASILEVRSASPNAVIIGSGGVRTAIDALKALRLGADLVGMARPFLRAYSQGTLREFMKSFLESLKAGFAMSGAKNIGELRSRPAVITGPLREWVIVRKLRAW